MEFIKFGKLVNTHGLRGEVKINSKSDFKSERFKKGNKLYIDKSIEVTVKSHRTHKNLDLVMFEEYSNINDVEKYKGLDVFVKKDNIKKLDEDEYYFFELEGLDVFENNQYLGKVKEIRENPANPILILSTESKDVMIPFVSEFIIKVDIDNSRIDISTIEGML
ncbi:ribosome maturation factor RimM [Mycoplasmatota bacterium zrk1]